MPHLFILLFCFSLYFFSLYNNVFFYVATAAIKPAPPSNDKSESGFFRILVVVVGAAGGVVLVILVITVAIRIRFQKLRQAKKGESRVVSSSDTVNISTSLAPIILKEPIRQSFEAEDIHPDLISRASKSQIFLCLRN